MKLNKAIKQTLLIFVLGTACAHPKPLPGPEKTRIDLNRVPEEVIQSCLEDFDVLPPELTLSIGCQELGKQPDCWVDESGKVRNEMIQPVVEAALKACSQYYIENPDKIHKEEKPKHNA